MNIIQDKIGNEFLRSNGGMDSNFGSGMIMFSHLPPVTSFTRLAAHSVMQDLPPHEMILKKERDSPDCSTGTQGGGHAGLGDYVHSMGIKQEKLSEHDYRLPLYPGGLGKSTELLDVSNNQNLQVHDLNMGNLPTQLGKEPSGRKGRRSNGEGQEGKPRKKRSEAKQSMMLDADGGSLSPGTKPHICEHCAASFRSSYHLRRHVLIHTGERPFRCSQCNMSFIQKYLLQRHEKIHSGEKPFSCDQCNMRFIQKYHMERHKRTHSGEKPYRCETCQQYFSRTDRLLKHKRTCGEAIRKGLVPGMMDLGCVDMGHGSYGITQGSVGGTGRKRGKSKNCGEGGERKKKKGDAGGERVPHIHGSASGGYSIHDYSMENQTVSSTTEPGPSMQQSHQGRAPKMAFKKANRKNQAKSLPMEQSVGMDGLGLMQSNGAKVGTSSNYDDAMQFLKKRRYLHAANNANPSGPVIAGGVSGEYDVSVAHLSSQPSVAQGVISSVMDSDAPLCLDKSGIPDEVLQSLLDHYTHKPDGSHHDVHFDISDQHVDLNPANGPDIGHGTDPSSPSGDKTVMMHEYSRFLLQALERTSHTTSFPLGPASPAPGPFTSSHPGNPVYADKNIYTTSPLECGFGQSVASPSLPSSVPKSHFAMLTGTSPQHSFHLSSLEPATHQQLTPSQELTEQMEKHHSSTPPSSYQISPSDLSSQKDQAPVKNGTVVFPLAPSQDLAPLDSSKSSYQIENFAQAFGSQFKSDGRSLSYGTDSSVEGDHRIQLIRVLLLQKPADPRPLKADSYPSFLQRKMKTMKTTSRDTCASGIENLVCGITECEKRDLDLHISISEFWQKHSWQLTVTEEFITTAAAAAAAQSSNMFLSLLLLLTSVAKGMTENVTTNETSTTPGTTFVAITPSSNSSDNQSTPPPYTSPSTPYSVTSLSNTSTDTGYTNPTATTTPAADHTQSNNHTATTSSQGTHTSNNTTTITTTGNGTITSAPITHTSNDTPMTTPITHTSNDTTMTTPITQTTNDTTMTTPITHTNNNVTMTTPIMHTSNNVTMTTPIMHTSNNVTMTTPITDTNNTAMTTPIIPSTQPNITAGPTQATTQTSNSTTQQSTVTPGSSTNSTQTSPETPAPNSTTSSSTISTNTTLTTGTPPSTSNSTSSIVPPTTSPGNSTEPPSGNTTTPSPSTTTPGGNTTEVTPSTTPANGNTTAATVTSMQPTQTSTGSNTTAAPPTTTTQSPVIVCPSMPCPPESVCLNSTCQCLSGSFLQNGRCVPAQVFPGQLHFLSLDFKPEMSDRSSAIFQSTAASISAALSDALKNEIGYKRSDVVHLQPGSVLASVNNIFQNTDATQESVHQAIAEAIANPGNGFLTNVTFTDINVCAQVPLPCDAATTVCSNTAGQPVCSCKEGFVSSVYSNNSCKACPSGQKAVGNTCQLCSFGYSGFNCNDSSLLAVVVISCVLGGVLLITILALLIYCCCKRCSNAKPDYSTSPYAPDHVNQSWPVGITPIPRATTNLEAANAMEMTEGGSTRALVDKKHRSNGLGFQLKKKVWKKSGSYDINPGGMNTFKGKNPSRYSYLVEGRENPYFLPGDERKN
ncbi:zinc finger protein 281-like [Solea senegalensis]|uniref:Zinc finger protein 281 n=2 Tax=Solea senegalensis TaxID=28829 RepID=A0AAV6RNJ7_SOLSE|nr:zinc finger protein 281-like [Solea senegalensis]